MAVNIPERKTKKQLYTELLAVVNEVMLEPEKKDAYIAFIKHELELIEKREEAKKAKKKEDTLILEVYDLLDDELQTLDDIMTGFEDQPEVTKAKVTNKLSTLVRDGMVEKDQIKVGSRKLSAYRKVATEE